MRSPEHIFVINLFERGRKKMFRLVTSFPRWFLFLFDIQLQRILEFCMQDRIFFIFELSFLFDQTVFSHCFNPLSANFTKWANTREIADELF